MRILIISYDFPPVNRSAALRAFGFAKYWSKMGVEVKVMCARRDRAGIPLNDNHEILSLPEIEVIDIEHLGSISAPKSGGGEVGGKNRTLSAAAIRKSKFDEVFC